MHESFLQWAFRLSLLDFGRTILQRVENLIGPLQAVKICIPRTSMTS